MSMIIDAFVGKTVLEDAERRRLEDSAINNWVNELKDFMYDAEDIIDLSLIEGSQLLDEHPFFSSNPSCNFSCFLSAPHRYEIGERINSINSRLEEIYKDRLQFNLDHQNTKTNLTMVYTHQTSPVIAELEVVGREIEDATKDMINSMIRGDVRKFSVFAITGIGGIGKTTFAQKIFNQQKVQTIFLIKLWVCVSQNYNENDLLKQVLEPLLRSAVSGKSVFLVLDDVWRADVWIDLLQSPLHSALIDSLILITSKDENVVKQMGCVYIHPVIQLPVETGWEMLSRRLATAGVLAKKEPIAKEWRKILNNNAWNMDKLPEEIRGALYLSYDDLPSPLKQCFHYCSLFPEDWILFREDLFISRNESFGGNVTEKSTISLTKLRRLASTRQGNATVVLDAITEPKCFRTLFIFSGFHALDFNQLARFFHLRVLDLTENEIESIPNFIEDLIHLRHHDLDRSHIRHLPESIGRLSNLQFLSLCGCKYLTYLPQSITQLQNLRRLALLDTPLSFKPKGIERLKQLNGLKGFVVGDDSDLVGGEQLFEELVPPKSLEKLYIKCYFGHSYPKWMMSLSLGSYLPYLSILDLVDNISSPLLPPLGQLPSLGILYIAGGNAIKSIGPEFLGGETSALSSHELIIIDCPKLRSLPGGLDRTGLKKLYGTGANSLKELENLTHFAEWIDLHENQSLERISNLPLLKCLTVRECYALKCVESLDELQQLELVDDSMDCLPEWLLRFIEELLRGREAQDDEDDFLLQLWCIERVLRRCQRGGEDWAFIQHIPRMNAYIKQGEGYLRFVKLPFCYETNI
ncbi:hypothetical protein IEQ34_021243 [Dendrobium chrysotoxum]|uniref:Disease resistance protein RGA3 n=1 Tax=Dendrobium chrysotoxum TaxID=161865 RepID=A0AAV7G2J7_DENCH|nr:hypothetical protein IEQ34_021243 [Dendrobium chrysotoxum]